VHSLPIHHRVKGYAFSRIVVALWRAAANHDLVRALIFINNVSFVDAAARFAV
jgi:hypothetical protein